MDASAGVSAVAGAASAAGCATMIASSGRENSARNPVPASIRSRVARREFALDRRTRAPVEQRRRRQHDQLGEPREVLQGLRERLRGQIEVHRAARLTADGTGLLRVRAAHAQHDEREPRDERQDTGRRP
jgi:hypothetical protein